VSPASQPPVLIGWSQVSRHAGEPLTAWAEALRATEIGPLVSRRQQARVLDHVRLGREAGARVVVGDAPLPDELASGNYVAPTLFAVARRVRTGTFGVNRYGADPTTPSSSSSASTAPEPDQARTESATRRRCQAAEPARTSFCLARL
jgi:acyl-CoA reductase-like NAD-dependent aldehyde dehydrogenase